jgi:cell division protein FtsB
VFSLRDFISPRQQLMAQQKQIRQLKKEINNLQAQNDSMREGMRRCITCEYRIDFKQRQDENGAANNQKN